MNRLCSIWRHNKGFYINIYNKHKENTANGQVNTISTLTIIICNLVMF